jgi:hypothetical protein
MPKSELELWAERTKATPKVLEMAKRIHVNASLDEGTDPAVIAAIMDKIMTADTESEIFAAANAGSIAGKDYTDRPFTLHNDDWGWKISSDVYKSDTGFPYYILADVTDLETGERLSINCGGFAFCCTMYKLREVGIFQEYDELGGMPLILKNKPTARGFNVVLLNKYVMPTIKGRVASKA